MDEKLEEKMNFEIHKIFKQTVKCKSTKHDSRNALHKDTRNSEPTKFTMFDRSL